jgi:sigma-B regulation protein RsbU (phosphoserine phosphatase)
MGYHRIRCGAIRGGVSSVDLDVATSGVKASVYSQASDGNNGGDIYYFSVCGSDKLTRVAIADLQGHGADVAPLSAWLYDALYARMNSLDGASVLQQLNAMVCQEGFHAITTAAVIGYYLGDSALYCSYAGHPPVLLQSRDSWRWISLVDDSTGTDNLPLGIRPQTRYSQSRILLRPGDRLCAYTDGVLECPDEDERPFGFERLSELLEQTGRRNLSEVKHEVLRSLLEHSGRRKPVDDITFMLIEAQ